MKHRMFLQVIVSIVVRNREVTVNMIFLKIILLSTKV